MNVFAKSTGMLALKPERIEACLAAGVTILGLFEKLPKGGILLADARPKKFVGGRGPNDPAATMLYVGALFKPEKTYHFESFERALSKAMKLAESQPC